MKMMLTIELDGEKQLEVLKLLGIGCACGHKVEVQVAAEEPQGSLEMGPEHQPEPPAKQKKAGKAKATTKVELDTEEAPETPAEKLPSIEEVRAILVELGKATGSSDLARSIIKKSTGADSFAEVPADKLGTLMVAAKEELAKLQKKAA